MLIHRQATILGKSIRLIDWNEFYAILAIFQPCNWANQLENTTIFLLLSLLLSSFILKDWDKTYSEDWNYPFFFSSKMDNQTYQHYDRKLNEVEAMYVFFHNTKRFTILHWWKYKSFLLYLYAINSNIRACIHAVSRRVLLQKKNMKRYVFRFSDDCFVLITFFFYCGEHNLVSSPQLVESKSNSSLWKNEQSIIHHKRRVVFGTHCPFKNNSQFCSAWKRNNLLKG